MDTDKITTTKQHIVKGEGHMGRGEGWPFMAA